MPLSASSFARKEPPIDHLEGDVGRHRRPDRDVAGAANTVHDLRTHAADGRWVDHACIDHHEASPRLPCEDGHRGATEGEVREHLTGHRLRVRAHAFAHHAVIGGGEDDRGRQGVNGHLARDRREPAGEILELAEAPRRLRLRIEPPARSLAPRLRPGPGSATPLPRARHSCERHFLERERFPSDDEVGPIRLAHEGRVDPAERVPVAARERVHRDDPEADLVADDDRRSPSLRERRSRSRAPRRRSARRRAPLRSRSTPRARGNPVRGRHPTPPSGPPRPARPGPRRCSTSPAAPLGAVGCAPSSPRHEPRRSRPPRPVCPPRMRASRTTPTSRCELRPGAR